MTSDISKIKTNFDKYVVKPLNFFGFGGFVFDVEGETTVTFQNEITDHFAEDNSTINDHIAVMPKRVTLRNYVGELSDIVSDETRTDIQRVTQKLTILNGLLPDLSDAAEQAQQTIQDAVNEGIDIENIDLPDQRQILDIYSIVQNFTPPVDEQAKAYLYFKALRDQKILLSVETPFEFMTNMAVETIVARQGEDSRFISDFTITLKEIRFANTEFVQLTSQGRRASQAQATDDRGIVNGNEVQSSVLYDIFFGDD